jgi:DNA-binding CsgD family transcriptional regulator
MAIEVQSLPEAAEQLGDLSQEEREVLSLLAQGLGSREISERLGLGEASVYVLIADLLDAIDFAAPAVTASDIHAAGQTRPADAAELANFHALFGPFESDSEG